MTTRDEIISFTYKIVGDADVAATAVTLAKTGTAADGASDEVIKLSDSLKTAASSATLIERALSEKAGLTDLTSQLETAKAGLTSLQAEFDATDSSSRKVTKAFSDAQAAVQRLTEQQTAASVALQKTEGALAKSGIDTSNLAAAYQKVSADGAAAANALAEIGTASSKAAQGTKDAAAGTKSLGDESKTTGGLLSELKAHLGEIVTAATAVELALKAIDFSKAGFAEATDVEQSLSRVKALAQGAAEDFDKLDGAIEDAARAANVSSSTAAQAASALAQQGETAAEIFQTLTPTLLLARDANIDVATSAGIVNTALKVFGLSASNAADVVDKLVVASKGSKDGLSGMASALRELGPDAQSIGLDFNQLLGLLSDLTQNGKDAGTAVRGLRTVFQDLQDPTSKFALALHDLGDSSPDFQKAIDTIRNSGVDGQKALLTLDGAARSLVEFLAQQAPGQIDVFIAALTKAQGAASQTRKALDDNLGGAATALENAFDSIGKGLADSTLGPLRDELQSLADRLNAFAASPAFKQLQTALTDLFKQGTAAFENFIKNVDWPAFVKTIQDGITDASKTIASFKDDIGAVASAINTIGAGIGVFARGIAVAFDALKAGVSASVAVVADLAAKFSSVQDLLTNGGFESGATRALLAIKTAAEDAANNGADALAKNLSKLGENLNTLGGQADQTAPKVEAVGKSIADASDAAGQTEGLGQTVNDFNAVSGTVDNLVNALDILTLSFGNTTSAQAAAATTATLNARALVQTRQAAADAEAELVRLAKSGNASAEAMQAAANKLKAAQDAVAAFSSETKTAADGPNALKQAFADLGISSQKVLDKAASDAKTNLGIIRQAFLDNQASVEDETRAFQAWATKLRASVADSSQAVKDQAEAQIAAEASALGLTDAISQAGDAGKKAGDDTKTSFDSAKGSIDKAKDSADDFTSAAKGSSDALADLGSSAQRAAFAQQALGTASETVAVVTKDQINSIRQLRDELTRGLIGWQEYGDQVEAIITGVDQQMLQEQQALADFQSQLLDAQSQLADAQGNQTQVEDIRHKQRLIDLQNEYELEHKLTSQQYQQLKKAEDDLHAQKLKNLQNEQNTQGGDPGSGAQGGGIQRGNGANPTPQQPANTVQRGAPIPGLTIDFSGATIIGGTEKQIGEQLARLVLKPLQEIARRSG